MKAKIIQDDKYPEMFRVRWPDGKISDMVNKTRVKDAIRRFEEYERRFAPRKAGGATEMATDAFKYLHSYPSTYVGEKDGF